MAFWISMIALLLIIVIALLFVFVLREHIFSRKTSRVLIYIAIGFIIIIIIIIIIGGFKLLTMPLITQEEAGDIAKDTISPYVEKKIYESQIHTEINNGNYLVSIDFREKGYAEVIIDTRSGEVFYAIINNFNGEDIEIY
ncbi:hypothetical protein FZW96_21380 [Bacillus sp. BGMRC 2118]|nr:hypothetical protein FZW96_21380 [Bacillus sp. BGMRC 2118]